PRDQLAIRMLPIVSPLLQREVQLLVGIADPRRLPPQPAIVALFQALDEPVDLLIHLPKLAHQPLWPLVAAEHLPEPGHRTRGLIDLLGQPLRIGPPLVIQILFQVIELVFELAGPLFDPLGHRPTLARTWT